MKKIFFMLMAVWGLTCGAQGVTDELPEVEMVSMADPEYEWMQYDEKDSKAMLKKQGLELESKKDDSLCATYCEMPFNTEDNDFVVIFDMKPESVDDKKPFGIIYDVENDVTYKAMVLTKKGYQVLSVADGKVSVLRKGMYKAKSKDFSLAMYMKKGKLTFFVNGLPMCTMKNAVIKNPQFGFVVGNKGKMECKQFGYKVLERDTTSEETDEV